MVRPHRRSGRTSKRKPVKFPQDAIVTISKIGAQGDGLSQFPSGENAYIPYSFVGDVVKISAVKKRGDGFVAQIKEMITPAAERASPKCQHFGQCGGCQFQHFSHAAYLEEKEQNFQQKFADYSYAIEPLRETKAGHRRRANFSLRHLKDGQFFFGFNKALSKDIINLKQCPLLTERLWQNYQDFFSFAKTLLPVDHMLDVKMTHTDSGVDIVLYHATWEPSFEDRQKIAKYCQNSDLAGLYLCREEGGFVEPLHQKDAPLLKRPGGYMPVSPGSFLQADQIGEAHMTELVEAVARDLYQKEGRALKMLDLFCGSGTFTFPLGQFGHVHAVEADKTALAKLEASAKQQQKTISTEARNLFNDPLMSSELNQYDLVLFDPPRAGAKAQAEKIAESNVNHVIAVSCNPNSLARDIEILVEEGFDLEQITPIDQFLWSSHIEAVAVLRR